MKIARKKRKRKERYLKRMHKPHKTKVQKRKHILKRQQKKLSVG